MFSKEGNPRWRRLDFALRASGADTESNNPQRAGVYSRGYLPHVRVEGASYFLTFRLIDSLPGAMLARFQQDRLASLDRLHRARSAHADGSAIEMPTDSETAIELRFQRAVERFLDRGAGGCCLRDPANAEIVVGALLHHEGERYLLRGWVVMPNHVHAVVWPKPNHLLSKIIQTWKGFTARRINERLGRTGQPLWQPETYDRWIRDDAEMARILGYIDRNPVIAGLCSDPGQWRWSSAGYRLE